MSKIATAKVPGPLAPFADGFRAELDRLGYTPGSREYKVNQMSRLSRWLEAKALGVGDIDSAQVELFLLDLGKGRKQQRGLRAMRPLMDFLGAEGLTASDPLPDRSATDDLLDDYRSWMVSERGLAARTIDRYEKTARRFLASRAATTGGGTGAEDLDAASVIAFLLAEVGRGLSPGSLQGRVAELRSLLRFAYRSGLTDSLLAQAIPAVPGWKDTAVPRSLAAPEVTILLESCDRTRASGKRDFAILLMLARLGLRAAEVGGLKLGDLDWRAGELVVHGKGRREDRVPLPSDVGEATACYVIEARPRDVSDALFLTRAAPPRPMGYTTVSQVVWRQCRLAGIKPVRAHRLRHALATDLLAHGMRLPDIAEVLRQRDLATAARYAKVDHAALRELALPWPGLGR